MGSKPTAVKLLAYAVYLIHHLGTLALQFYHIPSEQTFTLHIYTHIYYIYIVQSADMRMFRRSTPRQCSLVHAGT